MDAAEEAAMDKENIKGNGAAANPAPLKAQATVQLAFRLACPLRFVAKAGKFYRSLSLLSDGLMCRLLLSRLKVTTARQRSGVGSYRTSTSASLWAEASSATFISRVRSAPTT